MIATLLIELSDWIELAFVLAVGIGALVGWLLLRRGATRSLAAVAGAALLVAAGLTLVPTGLPPARVVCAVSFSLPEWGAVETSANIMLLLPAAMFAGLALRRPLLALGGGVVLSALIETAQALLPGLGRSCDTNDLWMNSIGVAVGAGIAALLLVADARRRRLLLGAHEPAHEVLLQEQVRDHHGHNGDQ